MSTENPYLAGLASVSRFTAPAAITPYTLGKVSAANTLEVMGTADADTKVAGVWLSGRSNGDNQGVPFCTARGVLLPMLSDGAGALAAGDNVSASTTTAGRVKLSTGAGIGIVLAGAPATADALVLVLFTGSGGSGSSAASTLAASYAAGASQTDSTLALDATRLGMRVRDNATPVSGGIFQVQNSDGTVSYFNVNSAGTISVKSGYTDGASANAFLVDTVNSLVNATARLLSLQTAGTDKFYVLASGGARFGASSRFLTGGDGLYAPAGVNGIQFYDSVLLLAGAGMRPAAAGQYLGSPGAGLWGEVGTRLVSTEQGSDLTITANAIAPTRMLHRVGAGLLKTITVPGSGAFAGSITLLPTAAFTWDATGNIDITGSAAVATIGKPVTFTYFATQAKWSASY